MRAEKELIKDRVNELLKLINNGINPYSYRWQVDCFISYIREKYKDLKEGEESPDEYSIAGRILSIRTHGKITFLDLMDNSAKIQCVVKEDIIGQEKYKILNDCLTRGDIIGVKGNIMKTKRGELSILVKDFEILSKILRILPDTWIGLEDYEVRFRQRYVDFIINENARKAIKLRARILKSIREFLDNNGFIEVETPILMPVYGGALARPFETYYHALKKKMYMRIAPELYLKRLIVGMFDRVYEISRCFRNEDIDRDHNPEFTQLEFYAAYWDCYDVMEFTKKLIQYVVGKTMGSLEVEYQGKTLDFSNIEIWNVPKKIKEEIGIDVNDYNFQGLKDAIKDIKEIDQEKLNEAETWGEVVEVIRESILEPLTAGKVVFMFLYPKDITPLAKAYRENPRWAERFEGFMDTIEFVNAYSELNNPIEQFLRFEEQEKLREEAVKQGKLSEAHPMDRDYVRALEYAMPPAGGCGIGIDRLVMVLGNLQNIREAIAFPMLRGEEKIETVVEMFPELRKYFE